MLPLLGKIEIKNYLFYMPKILEINGYKVYIYTNDHLPIHVHVIKGGCETKIILEPEIFIQSNYESTPKTDIFHKIGYFG